MVENVGVVYWFHCESRIEDGEQTYISSEQPWEMRPREDLATFDVTPLSDARSCHLRQHDMHCR